jgi:hypothetical protein
VHFWGITGLTAAFGPEQFPSAAITEATLLET